MVTHFREYGGLEEEHLLFSCVAKYVTSHILVSDEHSKSFVDRDTIVIATVVLETEESVAERHLTHGIVWYPGNADHSIMMITCDCICS